jgi:hypothetical protein
MSDTPTAGGAARARSVAPPAPTFLFQPLCARGLPCELGFGGGRLFAPEALLDRILEDVPQPAGAAASISTAFAVSEVDGTEECDGWRQSC